MNAPFLRPTGCPLGVAPALWRQAVQARIEHHADALAVLIDALDRMDGDPECEPALGAPEANAGKFEGWQFPLSLDQTHWADGQGHDERELEDEHGGDVQDEPHDYMAEGNGDYCLADELPDLSGMSDALKVNTVNECARLLAQSKRQLTPVTIMPFQAVQR